jgi:hypothetical protein
MLQFQGPSQKDTFIDNEQNENEKSSFRDFTFDGCGNSDHESSNPQHLHIQSDH